MKIVPVPREISHAFYAYIKKKKQILRLSIDKRRESLFMKELKIPELLSKLERQIKLALVKKFTMFKISHFREM